MSTHIYVVLFVIGSESHAVVYTHKNLYHTYLSKAVVSAIVLSFYFSRFSTVEFIWSEYAQLYEKDQKET